MRKWLMVGVLVVSAASLLAACGGDDEEGEVQIETVGNPTDRAFVAGMVPHHEAAIEMAEMAQERGESEFVASLADDIVRTQSEEIGTLQDIDAELAAADVAVGDLGLSEAEMAVEHDMSELETAKQFDRAFIDMMVPHHQGAIRMARVELAEGENADLMRLAEQIIDAQSREIDEMNAHRTEEFGGPSPAGGVPGEDGSGASEPEEMEGHSMDEM
jgi:uncharacterized protein (DUF305 family)